MNIGPPEARVVKMGIVGAGRMGLTHLAILRQDPRVRMVGLSEPSRLLRSFAGTTLGLPAYARLEELLEKEGPEAVVIATPPGSHLGLISRSLEAGCHVFSEKPLTTSGGEDRIVTDRAERTGRIGQVGYVYRSALLFRKAKEVVDSGSLGQVHFYTAEIRAKTVDPNRRDKSWRSEGESGGGCLLELGSHAIDMASYLFGAGAKVEDASLWSYASSGVEDALVARLRHCAGIQGLVVADWADVSVRKASLSVLVHGAQGSMSVTRQEIRVFSTRREGAREPGWRTDYAATSGDVVPYYLRGTEFTRQLNEFVSTVVDGSPRPISTFSDGADVGRIISEIREVAGQAAITPSGRKPW